MPIERSMVMPLKRETEGGRAWMGRGGGGVVDRKRVGPWPWWEFWYSLPSAAASSSLGTSDRTSLLDVGRYLWEGSTLVSCP